MRLRRLALSAAALWAAVSAGAADHSVRDPIVDQSAVVMTATTTGTAWLVERYFEGHAVVDVTAESGTVTLDVTIETAPYTTGPWVTHTTFTQITGVSTNLQKLTNLGKYLRFRYTLAGTTSMTLSSYLICKT